MLQRTPRTGVAAKTQSGPSRNERPKLLARTHGRANKTKTLVKPNHLTAIDWTRHDAIVAALRFRLHPPGSSRKSSEQPVTAASRRRCNVSAKPLIGLPSHRELRWLGVAH